MSVNAHLAVQRNAFSTAAAAAKVCDGRVSSSIAERQSNAKSFINEFGEQIFCLTPSIFNHEVRYSTSAATPSSGVVPYDAAGSSPTIHAFSKLTTTTAERNDSITPDQFRLVSAAMRLAPINASESNQGWFEAIRVRPSWSKNGWEFRLGDSAATPATVGGIFPDKAAFEQGLISSSNWANDPSYVTGRLRDLGKHTFYLQPTGERRFKKWPRLVTFSTFDNFDEQPCGFDTDFDIIFIRVHSSQAATTAETLKQCIHCHVVKNWETMYDAGNANARFHSATLSAESAVKYTDRQMTRDPKASMIRSASSYAYKF